MLKRAQAGHDATEEYVELHDQILRTRQKAMTRTCSMREPMVCGAVKSKGVPSTEATSPVGMDWLSTGR